MKNNKLDIYMTVLGVILLVIFGASAYVTGRAQIMESKKVGSIAEISVPEVPEVTTDRLNNVVSAAEWEPYYADIYASYMANKGNTGHGGTRISYVETDPDIQVIYDGMGFSFDYTEAIGHSYTLDDIAETTRPHKLANCLTCKTPDFTAMVNAMGKDAYAVDFDEMYGQVSEPVSCYNCHGNTPGTMVITHDYMADAMNDEIAASRVSGSVVSCAQCHIEYYFDPATKATSVPYDSLDNLDPDSILAFYNKMGFSRWGMFGSSYLVEEVLRPNGYTYQIYRYVDHSHDMAANMLANWPEEKRFLEVSVMGKKPLIVDCTVDDPTMPVWQSVTLDDIY